MHCSAVDRWWASNCQCVESGVIGLMLSANRDLTSAQCAGILQRTAQPLPGVSFEWQTDSGFGLINPEAAIGEATTFTERTERR